MVNKLFYGVAILSVLFIVSCSPKQSEIVVAEYGKYQITMDEFEKAYAKNIGSLEKAKEDSIENYTKFLDLYTNFKMKLRDAEVRQLPQDQLILDELEEYEKTIGKSYLLEKDLYEKGTKDLYEKRKYELRVSHLLIRTDTLSAEKANQKALDIIERIKNGASFEDEVKEHTDDQFSKEKGGDIYYITAGMIMPEFEEIAYNTPVGTVNSAPLKTKYGYHVIKVTEKAKRKEQIEASHILIKSDDKVEDGEKAEATAKEILTRIKAGEDFGKLALEFSDDPGSKEKNGALGFFSRRQMVQEFDEAAFNLNIGEVSDIVKTQFGYHIIKLTGVKEYPSYQEEKDNLRKLFDKTRKSTDYEKLLEKYSSDVKLSMQDDVIKEVTSNLGEVTLDKNYFNSGLQKNYGSKVLFQIENQSYTTDSLITFGLKDSKNLGAKLDSRKFSELVSKLKEEKVLENKAMSLAKNNKKFADLMDEYKNGILIFRLQEDEVWNEMEMDSVKIFNLYEDTKESYVSPDRLSYKEIFTKNDSLANVYLEMLKSGSNFNDVMTRFSERKTKASKGNDGLIAANTNLITKAAYSLENEGEYSDVFKNGTGWSIVQLIEKVPSTIKTFEEARAEVTSAYQDIESSQLENKYVSRLHKTYEPELFYEELENAYKN